MQPAAQRTVVRESMKFMPSTLSVRVFGSHEWHVYRDLRLRALTDSPDAFGSTLSQEQRRGDEEWSARLAGGAASGKDLPLVAEVSSKPVGLAWPESRRRIE